MNASMVELSPELQMQVEARLDAIERILFAVGVSRGERRGILSEVEAHVFELLSRRTSGEPTRADVLAVLSELDPPESYAPEGFDRRRLDEALQPPKRREPRLSMLATASAVAGVFLLLVLVMTVMGGGDAPVFLFEAALLFAASISGGISLFRIHRSKGWLSGAWPALVGTLSFPLMVMNVFIVIVLDALWDVAALLGLGVVFLAINAAIIYGAWRVFASGLIAQPAKMASARRFSMSEQVE